MTSRQLPVTTVILAGGLGTRMGGDKALHLLHDKPLLDWVLSAVSQDSTEVLINANDAQEEYARFGCRIIADRIAGWPGPLAGLHAALNSAETKYVMTVPCDTPFLPDDLIARLFKALSSNQSEAAVSVVDGYRQPTIALYDKDVLTNLEAFLSSGGRKVGDWLDSLQLSEVLFENVAAFDNINTPEDLSRASQQSVRERGVIETGITGNRVKPL